MCAKDAMPISQATTATTIRQLVFDGDACRACRACEMACSLTREGVVSPLLSCINITFDEFAGESLVTARFCLQCDDAPCMDACPVDAMSRHPRTGAVMIDVDLCMGCMGCAKACPWDIPKPHPEERLAVKCDLCSDSEEGPACVRFCPLAGQALAVQTISKGDMSR